MTLECSEAASRMHTTSLRAYTLTVRLVLQAQQGASLDLTRRITTEVNTGRNVTLFIFNGDISCVPAPAAHLAYLLHQRIQGEASHHHDAPFGASTDCM